MSKDKTTILNRLLAIMGENRTGALSDDVASGPVVSINKGQYVIGSATDKPCLWARLMRPGLISDMAGGRSRTEFLLFLITGACVATAQDVACDDATNLMDNVENLLANYGSDLWGGGHLAWNKGDDDSPAPFGELLLDVGQDVTTAHFQLLWGCEVRINTDPL